MLQLSLTSQTRHLIPISGKDSLATAIIQTTRRPDLDYEFLFNDTGSEYPEVYQWLNSIEKRMGWTINRTNVTIESKIQEFGGYLPSHQARWCTRECKIDPMDAYLQDAPTYAYYGLRFDENRVGFIPTKKNNLMPVYPLRELKITLPMVWKICESKNLLPPAFHWERLEQAVLDECPESKWFRPLEPWERRQLFAGRTRSNCYHCFYQRLYEWLWCYEVHPNLFKKALDFEKQSYSWNRDHPLKDWDCENFRDKIFQRRVKEVIQVLTGAKKESDSELSTTSCGLVCGK